MGAAFDAAGTPKSGAAGRRAAPIILRPMSRRTLLILLTVVIAAATIASPFQRDLFVGDETKYSQVLREMHRDGSFLVLTLEGSPYTHKPPGHFWMIYGLSLIFGTQSTFPYVIPSIVAFALMLLLLRRLARELFDDDEAALFAPFIFATFYLAWGLAQTARMDMSFHLLGALGFLHLFRFLRDERNRDLYVSAAAIGASILIKGPMTLVIWLLLFGIESYRQRRIPRGNYIVALLIVAAIPLAWLAPALTIGGRDYAEELLIKQNVGRAVGSWVHREPPWWYLQRFPITFLPWFFTFLIALAAWWKTRRATPDRRPTGFLISWLIGVVLPFSVISGKLDIYMLPAMIPAALLAARFITSSSDERLRRLASTGNKIILGGLALVFGLVPAVAPYFYEQEPDLRYVEQTSIRLLFIFTAVVGFALLMLLRWKKGELRDSAIALGGGALFPIVYLAIFLMPFANSITSTGPIVDALAKQNVDGRQIGLWQAPHLWSREMPDSFHDVILLDAVAFREGRAALPTLVVVRPDRAHHLGETLPRNYSKVDEVRTRGKTFAIYRRK